MFPVKSKRTFFTSIVEIPNERKVIKYNFHAYELCELSLFAKIYEVHSRFWVNKLNILINMQLPTRDKKTRGSDAKRRGYWGANLLTILEAPSKN